MVASAAPVTYDGVDASVEMIRRVGEDAQATDGVRAYRLLMLAFSYLTTPDKKGLEQKERSGIGQFAKFKLREHSVLYVVERLSTIKYSLKSEGSQNIASTDESARKLERFFLADQAATEAMKELASSSEQFAHLNMYYLAFRLFEQVGDSDGMKRCSKAVESAIRSCEQKTPPDEDTLKGCLSALQFFSNQIISVERADYLTDPALGDKPVLAPHFTKAQFEESEKLMLRGISLADRLNETDHIRRKAHRDLALWYQHLGKTEEAKREKEILFALVGIKNESILHPQSIECGQQLWWKEKVTQIAFLCGMG